MAKIHVAIVKVSAQYVPVAKSKIWDQELITATGAVAATWTKGETQVKAGRYWMVTPMDSNAWVLFEENAGVLVPAVEGKGFPLFKGNTYFFEVTAGILPSILQVAAV